MTMVRTGQLLLGLALLAAACGDAAAPSTSAPTPGGDPPAAPSTPSTAPPTSSTAPPREPLPASLARADVPRAEPDVAEAELAALVAGNAAFAYDLFAVAASSGDNTVISPYSVAAALTMTYTGARGDTAAEMRDVLGLGLGDDRIHAARNALDQLIATPPEVDPDDDRQPFTVRIANSLWGQAGYPFLDEFLVLLAEHYDAGMNLVDFEAAAEDARETINGRVEEQTEGRIVDLIPEGVVDELTRLVIVNAIWFKASWVNRFDPSLTADGAFRTLSGDEVTVPMMLHEDLRTTFMAGAGYQAVQLHYQGDASMILVVPDEGRFDEVAARFDEALLTEVRANLSTFLVTLSMPRFEFRSELGLKTALQQLGIEAAFTDPALPGGADFTGMTPAKELVIQDVVHQAFISVDEEGTEAAAATAVVVGVTSLPPKVELSLDRPFFFVIDHTPTGEPLFVGQVTDPS